MRALLALVLIPSLAAADVDEKGVRVGTVYTGLDHAGNTKPKFGAAGGAFIVQRFAPFFAIQVEGLLLLGRWNDKMNGVEENSFEGWAFELPVLLRLDVIQSGDTKLYLAGGGGVVISLGATEKDVTGSESRIAGIHGTNVALSAGLGLEFPAGPGRIAFDARYRHMLGPFADQTFPNSGSEDPQQSHMIMVFAGYAFP